MSKRPGLPFVLLAWLLGGVGGVACRAASPVVPDPWPSLLTTSATWGLLVTVLLLFSAWITRRFFDTAAAPLTPGSTGTGTDTGRHTGSSIPVSTGIWALAGAGCMTVLLLTSGAWISVLTVASAIVAGVLVGCLTHAIAGGRLVWVGAIGGLLMGEGIYGIFFGLGQQYLAEFIAGVVLCLAAAGRAWFRSILLGALVSGVIGIACLVYDAVRPYA